MWQADDGSFWPLLIAYVATFGLVKGFEMLKEFFR